MLKCRKNGVRPGAKLMIEINEELFAWGFEQRTKFRFVKQSRSKVAYRYNLRKKGYIESSEDHNLYFYPSEEMRRPIMESHATKYGIRFKQLSNPKL